MEVISIASLGLFVKIISDVDILTENKHIYQFYGNTLIRGKQKYAL